MTLLIVFFAAAILCGWLGWMYAQAMQEVKRLGSLVEHQKKTVTALLKVASSEQDLYKKIKKITEAEDEDDLTDIYNDIIK